MLKAIWNAAARGSAYLGQMRDGNAVQLCDNEIANAREGFRLQVIGNAYGAIAVKVDLTPDEAQKIIEDRTIRKAEVTRAMEKRRAEYGFKF